MGAHEIRAEIFAFADGSNQAFGLPIRTLHVKGRGRKKKSKGQKAIARPCMAAEGAGTPHV